MRAAAWPRERPNEERLLVVERRAARLSDGHVGDLPQLLEPGDLVVVNDAATLPASLRGRAREEQIELRLLGAPLPSAGDGIWRAVLFGAGDWHTPTENRPTPPRLLPGDEVELDGLTAHVLAVGPESERLLTLRFSPRGDALWHALYRAGRPVQYSYTERSLPLWHVQTSYAARPWAAEQPSAGRPLSWGLLVAMIRRGVRLARVTHAAGLSSTGDAQLDAQLPLGERYEVPEETARAVHEARARGGRVIAVGTSVVRALESAVVATAGGPVVIAAAGETTLRLGLAHRPRVVDGLLTGMHEPGTSHFELLEAFLPRALLDRVVLHAEQNSYLAHEFGDSLLLL